MSRKTQTLKVEILARSMSEQELEDLFEVYRNNKQVRGSRKFWAGEDFIPTSEEIDVYWATSKSELSRAASMARLGIKSHGAYYRKLLLIADYLAKLNTTWR